MRGVILALLLLVGLAVALRVAGLDEEYTTVTDLAPLAIAVLAAYLASCFQLRASLHASLRQVWSHQVEANTELSLYLALDAPETTDYDRAFKALSRAIDEIRGVYANVDASDRSLGLYPYEPLHDIRRALKQLDPRTQSVNSSVREQAKMEIDRAWESFRYGFLKEFQLPEPTLPITAPGSRDPRRALLDSKQTSS